MLKSLIPGSGGGGEKRVKRVALVSVENLKHDPRDTDMTRRTAIFLGLGLAILGIVWGLMQRGDRPPVPSAPFVAWAKQHAIPLKTAEPGSGFEDLQPFKKIVGRARVVGMGDATHGTHEFFRFKHRAFEFLVQEMGFTAIAMEVGFSEATKVNDYVLGGRGSALAVVKGLRYWFWDTEEVVALVEWMRDYNSRATTARKVTFYGFDLQILTLALHEAVGYLQTVDPQLAREFEPLRAQAAELQLNKPEDKSKRDQAAIAVRRLLDVLATNRVRLGQASSERGWRLADQNARVALQAITMWMGKNKDGLRDVAMTENVRWIAHAEGPAGRILLWAHNAHVAHPAERMFGWIPADLSRGFTPMGTALKKIFGPDYIAVGSAFNQGGFRALPLKTHSVGMAAPESFDGVLARVGPPIFALNFQTTSGDKSSMAWLQAEHSARSIALHGGVDDRSTVVPQEHYDAMVFFDRTTAVRPNARVK